MIDISNAQSCIIGGVAVLYNIDDIFQDSHNRLWKCVSCRKEPIETISVPSKVILLGDLIVGFRNILTNEYFEGTEKQLSDFTKLNSHE